MSTVAKPVCIWGKEERGDTTADELAYSSPLRWHYVHMRRDANSTVGRCTRKRLTRRHDQPVQTFQRDVVALTAQLHIPATYWVAINTLLSRSQQQNVATSGDGF